MENVFIHKELIVYKLAFVRKDRVVIPLGRLYDGPFKAIKRSTKMFKLLIKQTPVNISNNRLEPFLTHNQIIEEIETSKNCLSSYGSHFSLTFQNKKMKIDL